MTNKEAIKYLIVPIATSTVPSTEYLKLKEAYELAIKALEDRSQGEWKHNNFDEHYCNKCGHYALWSEEADDYYEVQSNFCPNCGADMKGGRQ